MTACGFWKLESKDSRSAMSETEIKSSYVNHEYPGPVPRPLEQRIGCDCTTLHTGVMLREEAKWV